MDEVQILRRAFLESPAAQVITRQRHVWLCNAAFAALFGYRPEELRDASLEPLYPSRQEFAAIGRRGLERMRKDPYYADERMMKNRREEVFWCRVRGVTLTPEEPFALAVWSFERITDRSVPGGDLTRREREIAGLMAAGLTSKEIARRLARSPRTVETHRTRLMRKLGARNAAEVVAQVLSPVGLEANAAQDED